MDKITVGIIEVKNCHECPFCNNDNEYGRDSCNLNDEIYSKPIADELPANDIHLYCPLKNESILVKQA